VGTTVAGTRIGDLLIGGGTAAYILVLAALVVMSGTIERAFSNEGAGQPTR
jgi:hypothetical protein